MSVSASAKGVRMSPRKVGEVVALVRGRSVADALVILEHTPRRAAQPVRKVIESARANAENNHSFKPDTLSIVSIHVTPGQSYKRYRPAAHGRALPFQRRSSHIFVSVDGEKRALKKPKTDDKVEVSKVSKTKSAKKEAN